MGQKIENAAKAVYASVKEKLFPPKPLTNEQALARIAAVEKHTTVLIQYRERLQLRLFDDTGLYALLDRMLLCADQGDADEWRTCHESLKRKWRDTENAPCPPPEAYGKAFRNAELLPRWEDALRRMQDTHRTIPAPLIALFTRICGQGSVDLTLWQHETRTKLRSLFPDSAWELLRLKYPLFEPKDD